MRACTVTSRAVVGSSAMSRSGSLARAMASMTRWRWPPDNSWGKADILRSGSWMPTMSSSSRTRSRARARRMPPWTSRGSATCFSTLCRGFRELMGSWKTMPTVEPRMARSSGSEVAANTSMPPTRMRPVGWLAWG